MNKSLILYTSLLLISPLTMALNLKELGVSFNIGNREVILGDATNSTKKLLGGELTTSSTTATGTTTYLSHSTPEALFEVSALVPFRNMGTGIKIAIEAQFPNTDVHTVNNGVSKTATVIIDGYGGVYGNGDTLHTDNAGDFDGAVGITSIACGQLTLTVEHRAALAAKVLYAFGENTHGAGIGFSILNTRDTYKYTVDINPSGTGSGVFSTTAAQADLFAMPAFSTGTPIDYTNSPMTAATYTPVTGTTATYDDNLLWVGTVAEGSAKIHDSICLKGGLGYYIRQFETSNNSTISAPMIAERVYATITVGHIGLTFKAYSF